MGHATLEPIVRSYDSRPSLSGPPTAFAVQRCLFESPETAPKNAFDQIFAAHEFRSGDLEGETRVYAVVLYHAPKGIVSFPLEINQHGPIFRQAAILHDGRAVVGQDYVCNLSRTELNYLLSKKPSNQNS